MIKVKATWTGGASDGTLDYPAGNEPFLTLADGTELACYERDALSLTLEPGADNDLDRTLLIHSVLAAGYFVVNP